MSAAEISVLTEMLIEARRDIAELRRETANMVRVGVVAAVDAEKGYRLNYGNDDKGEPKLSAWLPHPEQAGGSRGWAPLALGQIAAAVSSPGDPRKGLLLRGGFCDQYQAPSTNLEEDVWERGDSRLEVRKDDIKVTATDIRRTATEHDDIRGKILRFMGLDKILMQAKSELLHMFTSGDVLIEAKGSITLMAPTIALVYASPPDRPDLLEEGNDLLRSGSCYRRAARRLAARPAEPPRHLYHEDRRAGHAAAFRVICARSAGPPLTEENVLLFWTCIGIAVDIWEPRFRVVRVGMVEQTAEVTRQGQGTFVVEGEYRPLGHKGDFTPEGPVRRILL